MPGHWGLDHAVGSSNGWFAAANSGAAALRADTFISSYILKNDTPLVQSERLRYFAAFCQPRPHIVLNLIGDDA